MRELLCGGRSLGDVQRGIPRISRTMLSARQRELGDAGVIARDGDGHALTASGRALEGVIREPGVWGQKWLPRTWADDELDLDALVWDMRRRVDADHGDFSFDEARRRGPSLDGPSQLVRAFPAWWRRYLLAEVRAISAVGRRSASRTRPTAAAATPAARAPSHSGDRNR